MTDPFLRATAALFRNGDAATYTPTGGDPVPCRVIPSRGAEETGEYGAVMETVTRIAVQTADVAGPARGDQVQIGVGVFAGTYTVDRLESTDGYQSTVIVR